MSDIRRDQVAAIAAALSTRYGVPFDDAQFRSPQATITPGAHEESACPWILLWEECPDPDWVHADTLREAVRAHAPDFFAEPINHWATAFWPTH